MKKEFVHLFGQLLTLYWDARSAKHQNYLVLLLSWCDYSKRLQRYVFMGIVI